MNERVASILCIVILVLITADAMVIYLIDDMGNEIPPILGVFMISCGVSFISILICINKQKTGANLDE